METLLLCDACRHGAIVHEVTGCTFRQCACKKTLTALVDEALEAARSEIRRDWHIPT